MDAREEGDTSDEEYDIVEVPISMVKQNPWAENVAGKLPQMLAEIGTLDMWCTKFGMKKGDTWNTMERVARLVSEGTKTWRFYPTIAKLRETMLGCTVIESTWWILVRSENKTDDLLYKHLSEHTVHFHPHVWRPRYGLLRSKQILRNVHKAQKRQLAQWKRDLDKLWDLSERAAEAGRRHMRVQDPQVPQ
jgi:hypothetical protein